MYNALYELRGYKSIWERIKVAYRVLRYGEPFPRPLEWYDTLVALVDSPLSKMCKRAVEKVNLEYTRDKTPANLRMDEAIQWSITYAKEAGLYHPTMRFGTFRFLIEWWVARLGHKF